MGRYILRRIGQGLTSVFLLAVLMFFLSRATGDPLALLLPADAPPEARLQLESQLGLDRPTHEQFVSYLGDLARGDLGESIRYRIPVWDMYKEAFPNTMRLLIPAFVLAFTIGVPLGVFSATSPSRVVRRGLLVFGVAGMAAPLFWVAVMLVYVFAVQLDLLPAGGTGGLSHYVLPVCALTLFLLAGLIRLVRSRMLESLDSEYIKLARLKGLSERRVVWKHALRNSVSSALEFMGVMFSSLVVGSVVIEKVFAWPGAGRLVLEGILSRDYPVVQGLIIIAAVFIVAISIVVDILHAAVDPRVRL